MIDSEEVRTFLKLVSINGESGKEQSTAEYCRKRLHDLGMTTWLDDSGASTGSNSGNLFAVWEGTNSNIPPVALNAHLDTVSPGQNIRPVIQNGVIYSSGDTILGADNRAGITAVIEGLTLFRQSYSDHGRIEVIFTTCEESGLLGAKHVDIDIMKSRSLYVLDSSGLGSIVLASPYYDAVNLTITGRSAHAAVDPEKGINAIKLAAEFIRMMPCGRLNKDTTVNIGVIKGGRGRNVVPDECQMEIEMRSHSKTILEELRKKLEKSLRMILENVKETNHSDSSDVPFFRMDVTREFNGYRLDRDSTEALCAEQAIRRIDRTPIYMEKMGGSDANIFNERGITSIVLGTGQSNVHSYQENISMKDIIDGCRLVKSLLETWIICHRQKIS